MIKHRASSKPGTCSRREVLLDALSFGAVAVIVRPAACQRLADTRDNDDAISLAQCHRIAEMMRESGQPLPADEEKRLLALWEHPTVTSAADTYRILDEYTLMRVRLDRRGIGRCSRGGAIPELVEKGWRAFLVRIENPARLTGQLVLVGSSYVDGVIREGSVQQANISAGPGNDVPEILYVADQSYPDDIVRSWMGYRFGPGTKADPGLIGTTLEYQVLQVYSQTHGRKKHFMSACISSLPYFFQAESGGVVLDFDCLPASTVTLAVRDSDGVGATASLLILDEVGRVYPAPAHRLEPDLGFLSYIYRSDGESVRLPVGQYEVLAWRGPEYRQVRTRLLVPPAGAAASLRISLDRWINPARLGWYSGEHHIHGDGQTYGRVSGFGLTPETMLRQVRGEGLNVGSIVVWGGGYYYQKQFLTGHVYSGDSRLPFPEAQRANDTSFVLQTSPRDRETLIRYDVEQAATSYDPLNPFGHLLLLRLKNHDFPNARSLRDWPAWNLPVVQWARAQGGVIGYAHSGLFYGVQTLDLPNYEIPRYNLGANECLVDVTYGLIDFVSGGHDHPTFELNFWYHLLNSGFQIPMIGETDSPYLGSRPGMGRTYVKLQRNPIGDNGYDEWVEGIKSGRLYFGDGRSHLLDFRVNAHLLGEGPLELSSPAAVVFSAKVAAWLDDTPIDPDADLRPYGVSGGGYPYWHLERARIGTTRSVPLELVVNGRAVERREVRADGELRDVSFTIDIQKSSWVALRILPSVHTAPIFVRIAGQPVRASKRSAQWCLDFIEALWSQTAYRLREGERTDAAEAWDHARSVYRKIISECTGD